MIILFTGCSTISNTTNFEIDSNENLTRTYIYDWCEESSYSLGLWGDYCFGIYGPPVYSYKYHNGYYVFYPILINYKQIAFGPLIVPFIPLNMHQDTSIKTLTYKVRSYESKIGKMPKPIETKLHLSSGKYIMCSLKYSNTDKISDIFTCDINVNNIDSAITSSELTIENGEKIKIYYSKRKEWTYLPIVAPNGPRRSDKPYIRFE